MFRYIIILVVLVLASASPGMAVDTLQVTSPDPVLESWRWTEFDRSSGMTGRISEIFEDRDGNLWFATDIGAHRYDGRNWTTYTTEDGLASRGVRAVYQTRDGAMWFATGRSGLTRFDGETWTTYTTEDSLASNVFRTGGMHEARDGTLWAGSAVFPDSVGTQSGISRFDGTTWTTVEVPVGSPRPNILDIHQTQDGALWFSTWRQGLLRFDSVSGSDGGWTRYTTEDGLAGNTTSGILEARDGSLWVASSGAGINRFDGKKWHAYTAGDGLPEGGRFRSLWQMADGAIWTIGGDGELCRFDGTAWQYSVPENGPQTSRSIRGTPVRDGSIWFYLSRAEKAYRFDPTTPRWTVYPGLPSVLSSSYAGDVLFAIEDEIWLNNPEGLLRYDGTSWIRYTADDGLIDGSVTTVLKAADGSIWVAGQHRGKSGAARFDGSRWQVYSEADGLVGGSIYVGFVAGNGDIWFGTKYASQGAGVMRYDGRTWTVYTTEDGLIDNHIYTFAQTADGAVWIGTINGLSRFDPNAESDDAQWTKYTPGDSVGGGLAPHKIRGLLADREGNLWMGYDHNTRGTSRFDGKTWTRLTTEDGLGSDAVWEIFQGQDGSHWFGTEGGITRFDGRIWTAYPREEIPLLFAGADGIRTLAETSDGGLWMGANSGIARFVPDRNPPETRLEPAADQVSSAGNILLRWSGQDLWNHTPSHKIRYQWRMDSGDWSAVANLQAFTFTSLSDGAHQFEVRSIDQDGNIDPNPVVHAFIVEGPWWKNPWVLGSAVVLLGLVGVQTGRVVRRERRLEEANKDLIVEAVLERVRAQALGMQESDDLLAVNKTLFQEFEVLGLKIRHSVIQVWDEEKDTIEVWGYQEDGSPWLNNTPWRVSSGWSGKWPLSEAFESQGFSNLVVTNFNRYCF